MAINTYFKYKRMLSGFFKIHFGFILFISDSEDDVGEYIAKYTLACML